VEGRRVGQGQGVLRGGRARQAMTEKWNDVVLVHRTTVREEAEYLGAKLNRSVAEIEKWAQRLTEVCAKLTDQMRPGDELWHFRSRFIGPLAGFEGIALVRDGAIVDELTLIDY
jgi:hypothetical protein